MSIPSSQSRPAREPQANVACGTAWSSRKGAAWRLLVGAMLLLAPAHAAKMSPAEYQEATQALQHGAEWVPGGGGHYFWRAHAAMATPPAAGESWYLHTGPVLDGVRRRLPETFASMVICAAGLVAGRRSTVSRALLTATPSPPLHLAPQARPASILVRSVPSLHGLPSQARQCLCAVARLRSVSYTHLTLPTTAYV